MAHSTHHPPHRHEGGGPDRWRPHPWHGLEAGVEPPERVLAYIEMTPFDLVKYEIDKRTGYLRIDRPQRGSSLSPTLYGFIPRTYCGEAVAARNDGTSAGDGDPLDICVICERPVSRAEVILNARVVGGIRTLDHGLADDKIVSVLEDDPVWGVARVLADVPEPLVDRLCHYFSTYKVLPGRANPVEFQGTYDRDEAQAVIRAAMEDYDRHFGGGGEH